MESRGEEDQVQNFLIRPKRMLTSCSVENTGLLEGSKSQIQEQTNKPKPKDGFEALKGLQHVRNVICVAFGAFDRYYISWEDNEGEFHQGWSTVLAEGSRSKSDAFAECQALPECLNRWLFPSDGQTRDLQTLQVSLGSNDEFFASDKDGKLSSRDPSCQIADKKPVPRLAEIARGMMRKKSHTISSPTLPEVISTRVDPNPEAPRLVRRSTFQIGQENYRSERKSIKTPLTEQPQLTRLEPKSKPQATDAVEEELLVKNLDDGTVKKLATVPHIEQAQLTLLELKMKSNLDEEPLLLKRPNGPKIEHSRRKSVLIGAPPPVRPTVAKIQTALETRESLQSRGIPESTPVIRPPLPKMKIPSPPGVINQPQRYQEIPPAAKVSSYVDAGVQTEIQVEVCGNYAPLQVQLYPTKGPEPHSFLPPQHDISIGYMQDFCRDEYQLGGMLSTYV
jgi:hypothetical protein